MAEKRKDMKGRNLRTGEYYDEKNQRYMFRKMVAGNRITITAANLLDLRKQENDLLCKIDKGIKLPRRQKQHSMNILTIGLNILPRQGEKPQPVQIISLIITPISERR